jgi:hypothetical protein
MGVIGPNLVEYTSVHIKREVMGGRTLIGQLLEAGDPQFIQTYARIVVVAA